MVCPWLSATIWRNFDVMRIDDEFFDVNIAIPESLVRFHSRGVKTSKETRLVVRGAHSATASASSRFDHHRIADFLRKLLSLGLLVLDNAVASGVIGLPRPPSAKARRNSLSPID